MQYFFITVNIKKEEIKMVSCPTNDMLVDIFTNLLQGTMLISLS